MEETEQTGSVRVGKLVLQAFKAQTEAAFTGEVEVLAGVVVAETLSAQGGRSAAPA